jgi:hypothetical protein
MLGLPLGIPVLVGTVFPSDELNAISLGDELKDSIALLKEDRRLDIGVGLIEDLKAKITHRLLEELLLPVLSEGITKMCYGILHYI